MIRDNYAFPVLFQRLFSIDRHIVLLEENTAKNPELDYNCFELANMDNSKCKANFSLKT